MRISTSSDTMKEHGYLTERNNKNPYTNNKLWISPKNQNIRMIYYLRGWYIYQISCRFVFSEIDIRALPDVWISTGYLQQMLQHRLTSTFFIHWEQQKKMRQQLKDLTKLHNILKRSWFLSIIMGQTIPKGLRWNSKLSHWLSIRGDANTRFAIESSNHWTQWSENFACGERIRRLNHSKHLFSQRSSY